MSRFKLSRMVLAGGMTETGCASILLSPIVTWNLKGPLFDGSILNHRQTDIYTKNTTSTSKKENDGFSYPPPPSVCPSWFLFYLLLLLLRRQTIVVTLKRELTTVLAQRRQLCALDATPCSTRSSPVTLLRKREAMVCGGARRTCCWRHRSAYPHFSETVFWHETTVAKRLDDNIHFTPIYFVYLFIKWVFRVDF